MPTVISSSLVLGSSGAGASVPLTHPRILWDDWCRRGTVTASTEAAGYPVENATDYLTYDWWRPSAVPAWIEVEIPLLEPIDACLIAAHTIGSSGCSVKVQIWDGSAWTDASAETLPANDRVIFFLFDEVYATRARIYIQGGTVPDIGVVMFGKALATQRALYQGHSPINLSRRTTIRPNTSDSGQWLGRSIRRAGVATSITINNQRAGWIRDHFSPFIEAARTYPFGWAWRPQRWPEEVALVWVNDDIVPQNSGPIDMMTVTMDVEGHIE